MVTSEHGINFHLSSSEKCTNYPFTFQCITKLRFSISSEAENELQRVKVRVIRSEEERHVMERKVAETEVIVHRMVEEAERRQHEAETLRKEVRMRRL